MTDVDSRRIFSRLKLLSAKLVFRTHGEINSRVKDALERHARRFGKAHHDTLRRLALEQYIFDPGRLVLHPVTVSIEGCEPGAGVN